MSALKPPKYIGGTMFDGLSSRLRDIAGGLRGRGRLTEDNIKGAVRDVRMALA